MLPGCQHCIFKSTFNFEIDKREASMIGFEPHSPLLSLPAPQNFYESGQIRATSQINGGMGGTHGKLYGFALRNPFQEELFADKKGGFLRYEILHFC